MIGWKRMRRSKFFHTGSPTVCWIGVKVAVLCARQYMSWNIFLIKVLNNFWYFEHPILTMICSEAYLKHYWRNCNFNCIFFLLFSKTNLQLCFKHASEQIPVEVWCLKYQKIFKIMIRSRFHGMYWRAHKTATLTSFQRTVPSPPKIFRRLLWMAPNGGTMIEGIAFWKKKIP